MQRMLPFVVQTLNLRSLSSPVHSCTWHGTLALGTSVPVIATALGLPGVGADGHWLQVLRLDDYAGAGEDVTPGWG